MTDKEKTIKELKEALDSLDITNKYRLNLIRAIEYLQEEPVSGDLEEAALRANMIKKDIPKEFLSEYPYDRYGYHKFIEGAKWQKAHLWKPADGDDLSEIDREVIALTQPYSDDDEHLKVVFAHRPNKYTKVWNSDLGEEQVTEIERYGKGEWNIPFVKYWLDVELPKEIEL